MCVQEQFLCIVDELVFERFGEVRRVSYDRVRSEERGRIALVRQRDPDGRIRPDPVFVTDRPVSLDSDSRPEARVAATL